MPAINIFYIPIVQTTEGWETWIQAQNAGLAPGKFGLLLFGYSGLDCSPQCTETVKLEMSGLVPMGAAWTYTLSSANVVDCSGQPFTPTSGILVSLSPDQWMYAEKQNCSAETEYVKGLWLNDTAAGQPAAVTVSRIQTGGGGQTVRAAAYVGISDTMPGQRDPRSGAYMYYATLNLGQNNLLTWQSTLWMQNIGRECASSELWYYRQGDCLRADVQKISALCPGETIRVDPTASLGAGWLGSVWIRATQPLGVIVDEYDTSGSVLMSYRALPADLWTSQGMATRSSLLNQAPLIYREFNGWNASLQVQNLSPVYNALVKVYFYDNSGDLTTMVDWICPRGSQTFDLRAINSLPGQYVGWARVESQNWWGSGNPPVDAPYIQTVVNLVNANTGQGLAYTALPARRGGGEWQVLALPKLMKNYPVPGLAAVAWDSEIAVTNLNLQPNVTVFRLDFFDQNGLLYSLCRTINEKQVEHVNLDPIGIIPTGWLGSAVISVQCGPGSLGAVVVERGSSSVSGDLAAGYEALPLPAELLELYRDYRLFSRCTACR